MCQFLLDRNHCLNNHILCLSHDLVWVETILFQTLEDFFKSSLVASIVIHRLGHLEVLILLVHSIVGQVHVQVVHRLLVCVGLDGLVLMCSEAYETFLIEEYL